MKRRASDAPTLVLRVRFMTFPALMTRSNSKLPFWFTGDMTLALLARKASRRGWWRAGVSSFMGAGRMVMGLVGVWRVVSVMVTAMFDCAASRDGCGLSMEGDWAANGTVWGVDSDMNLDSS